MLTLDEQENHELYAIRLHEVTHAIFHELQGYNPEGIVLSSEKIEGHSGSCTILSNEYYSVDTTTSQYKRLQKYNSLSGVFNASWYSWCCDQSEMRVVIEDLMSCPLEDTLYCNSMTDECTEYLLNNGYGQSDWTEYLTYIDVMPPCEGEDVGKFFEQVSNDLRSMLIIYNTYYEDILTLTNRWMDLDKFSSKSIHLTCLPILRLACEY